MRADEIREMGPDDITARIKDLEEERFRLKFRSATEPLEDPLRLRLIRKDIARLKTIASERAKGIVREGSTAASAGAKQEKGKKSTARRPAKKGAAKTKAR
ncbi:MAG TPA: 50S ribosomal protein L29 [Gemmatimonadaceae bacterium]|nr:50S ribosomal protein L29 [Gemmatimonadaceae bacterium]